MATDMFALIASSSDVALRSQMLGGLAALRGVSLADITAEFNDWNGKNAEKVAKAARKALLERLNNEAKSMTLSDANLGTFVSEVIAAKGTVTLNADLTLNVGLPGRGGNGGGGRVADDYEQPFVSAATGKRVLGPITKWLDANYSEQEQKRIGGVFRPNGKRHSGAKLATALVKAGILESFDDDDDDSEEE